MQVLGFVADHGERVHNHTVTQDGAAFDARVGVDDAARTELHAFLHDSCRMNRHEWRDLASIAGRLQVGAVEKRSGDPASD